MAHVQPIEPKNGYRVVSLLMTCFRWWTAPLVWVRELDGIGGRFGSGVTNRVDGAASSLVSYSFPKTDATGREMMERALVEAPRDGFGSSGGGGRRRIMALGNLPSFGNLVGHFVG